MKEYQARVLVSRETRHPISDRDCRFLAPNLARDRGYGTAWFEVGISSLRTKCPFALDPNLSGEVPRNISSVAKPISKEGASALDVALLACCEHGCEEL
jgi:hypothetical protein